MVSRRTWRDGQESASLAREPRFISVFGRRSRRYRSQTRGLNPSTLIWWALYLRLRVSPTHWQSLIGFRNGRKRSLFRTSAWQRWPGLSSGNGFPISAYRQRSSLTGGPSSSRNCGQTFHCFWEHLCSRQRLIIPRQIGWWSGFTGSWRLLPVPAWVATTGWINYRVMLVIRARHKDDMGASLAEMVYGTLLVFPSQFCSLAGVPTATEPFLHNLRRAMENLQPVLTSAHCKAAAEHVPEVLQKCPMVWIRQDGYHQPLTPRYEGPFHVLERHPKFFKIQLGEKQDNISIDQLKPDTVPEGTQPARPRKRGRPAKSPLQQPERWNQQRRSRLSHRQHHRGGYYPLRWQVALAGPFGYPQRWGALQRATIRSSDSVQCWGKCSVKFSRWNIFSR